MVVFRLGKSSRINNRLSLSTAAERLNYSLHIPASCRARSSFPFLSESYSRDRDTEQHPRESPNAAPTKWRRTRKGPEAGAASPPPFAFFKRQTAAPGIRFIPVSKEPPVTARGDPVGERGRHTWFLPPPLPPHPPGGGGKEKRWQRGRPVHFKTFFQNVNN